MAYRSGQTGGEGSDRWLGVPFIGARLRVDNTAYQNGIGARALGEHHGGWPMACEHGRRGRHWLVKRGW
jgi:hypothetical protein